jgi:hypothetical protein
VSDETYGGFCQEHHRSMPCERCPVARREPNRSDAYHEACPDCTGYISEYHDHDPTCPRLNYKKPEYDWRKGRGCPA